MKDYNIWVTREGTQLKISEMTTQHLKNCVNMIKRSQFPDYPDRYEFLPEPPQQVYCDYDRYQPYLKPLNKELKKRNERLI